MPQRNLPAFLDVQDDHPLVAELTSLRAAVERYQVSIWYVVPQSILLNIPIA